MLSTLLLSLAFQLFNWIPIGETNPESISISKSEIHEIEPGKYVFLNFSGDEFGQIYEYHHESELWYRKGQSHSECFDFIFYQAFDIYFVGCYGAIETPIDDPDIRTDKHLFISENGGASWSNVSHRIGSGVLGLASSGENVMYAVTLNGLLRSQDQGTNWSAIVDFEFIPTYALPFPEMEIFLLKSGGETHRLDYQGNIERIEEDDIISAEHYELTKPTIKGNLYANLDTSEENVILYDLEQKQVIRNAPIPDDTVVRDLAFTPDSTVYLATSSGLYLLETDSETFSLVGYENISVSSIEFIGEKLWTATSQKTDEHPGLPVYPVELASITVPKMARAQDDNQIYGISGSNVYRYNSQADQVDTLSLPDDTFLSSLLVHQDRIFADAWEYQNGNWSAFIETEESVNAQEITPSGIHLIGMNDKILRRNATWETVLNTEDDTFIVEIKSIDSAVFALTESNQLLVSYDDGSTSQVLNEDTIGLVTDESNNLYIRCTQNIYRYQTEDDQFVLHAEIPSVVIPQQYPLAVGNQGNTLIITSRMAAIKSNDGGQTWHSIINGLPADRSNFQFKDVLISGDNMYFSISNAGVYRGDVNHVNSPLPTSSPTENERVTERPTHIKLYSPYPNPFNPVTVISYHLPESSDIRLEVFDMLGRRVTILKNGYAAAGHHEVIFNATGLSSGLYIIRLQNESGSHSRRVTLVK